MSVPDLRTRWRAEGKELGVSAASLTASIETAPREVEPRSRTTAQQIIERLSTEQSTWHRMDVLRAVTEARDTLERILANDRADLPAVSQRRELATQDHAPAPSRPTLTPRCTVPPSFNDLLREAVTEVEDVQPDRPTTSAQDGTRSGARTCRTRRHCRIRQAPFAAAVSEAGEELSEARNAQYQANIDLGGSNRLTRRGARRRLAEADQSIDTAIAKVNRVDEAAGPTANALAAADQAAWKANDATDNTSTPSATATRLASTMRCAWSGPFTPGRTGPPAAN